MNIILYLYHYTYSICYTLYSIMITYFHLYLWSRWCHAVINCYVDYKV